MARIYHSRKAQSEKYHRAHDRFPVPFPHEVVRGNHGATKNSAAEDTPISDSALRRPDAAFLNVRDKQLPKTLAAVMAQLFPRHPT
jgi:hypothetical protein